MTPEKAELLAVATLNRHFDWPKVKRIYLKTHRICAACGRTTDLEVHHKVPFWEDRNLELNEANLITLCASHHWSMAHYTDFKSYNENIKVDAAEWRERIKNRPKWKQLI